MFIKRRLLKTIEFSQRKTKSIQQLTGSPSAISIAEMPSDQMSTRSLYVFGEDPSKETRFQINCQEYKINIEINLPVTRTSGAMKYGVPASVFILASLLSVAFEAPKSANFTTPSAVNNILSDLTSLFDLI